MILEEETFKEYGYYSKDLSKGSHKKVIAKCDDCGKVRKIENKAYRDLCHQCAIKNRVYSYLDEDDKKHKQLLLYPFEEENWYINVEQAISGKGYVYGTGFFVKKEIKKRIFISSIDINPLETAYIAGLFDGEGSVSIIKNIGLPDRVTPYYHLVVSLGMYSKEPIYYLKESFKKGSVNTFYDKKNQKMRYTFTAASNDASHVLSHLIPFLKVKKLVALLGIQFQEKMRGNSRGFCLSKEMINEREMIRKKVMELNRMD